MESERRRHWEEVYSTKSEDEVSWFQESPAVSLALQEESGLRKTDAIIDVGGGASRLVDALVAGGYQDITVLDLSSAGLEKARNRLGERGDRVQWIAADVTSWDPPRRYDVWHDRAAFHFLTDEKDRQAYFARLEAGLRPGGILVIGAFATDGPERCSGLPVMRYDSAGLSRLLGESFELVSERRHDHLTPWKSVQRFQFCAFRRRSEESAS